MMYEAAKIKAGQKKIVFTKTLDKSVWENTELARGNLSDEIKNLKNQSGKDIIVYGGSSFVADLLIENLIDEFYLFVNPIALGQGIPIFDKLNEWQRLKLVKSKTFECGLILLNYERH